MKKQSGIHPVQGQAESAFLEPLPDPVLRIYTSASAGLTDLLLATFDAIDDSLFELANHARNNNDQNRYFETMREVRIKRKGVEKRFQEGLANLFRSPPSLEASPEDRIRDSRPETGRGADSLSLVQNDQLEKQVAISAMVSKANASFQGPLLQLQSRFTAVYERDPHQPPVNPLAPEHLCHLFVEVCQDMDIAIREQLIILKHYDRYVVANLGQLLEESNRILVSAGVIPDFRYQGHNSDRAQPSRRSQGRHPKPQPLSQGQILKEIESLLARQRREGHPREDDTEETQEAEAGSDNGPEDPERRHGGQSGGITLKIDARELTQLLSELPQTTMASDLSAGKPQSVDLHGLVRKLLQEQSGDGRRVILREADEDLINLVSMLFEFILEDCNLSPPIQVLISRLQIPVLKVVIRDRAFFSKPGHPARRLLNALARAGIGWSDSSEKNRDRLYHKIHDIVLRILNDFDGDMTLFDTLDKEFDAFLQREERKSRLVEQRTRESEQGRIKSQKAQETVDAVLQQKLAQRNIPESIRDILLNGWNRVLFLAYLRDDTDHRWAVTLRAVDDLLWCLRPLPDGHERQQWVRVVPPLLKTLRSGLEEVSYNASRLDAMMSALKRELTEAFRRQASEAALEDISDTPPEATEEPAAPDSGADKEVTAPKETIPTAVEQQKAREESALEVHRATLERLPVGQWVEFSLVNGSRFRCKLSAVIPDADSYVFVNRMGLKVADKQRDELAHELRRGRLRILEQGALIDRAMDAILNSLSRKAG
ncbi:MAG: DUF1631 domain-containing protein [Oleiphilaceae bacterium]|nr:DUF1631 domain-containing protein [Oleiphilaceae bacterium]